MADPGIIARQETIMANEKPFTIRQKRGTPVEEWVVAPLDSVQEGQLFTAYAVSGGRFTKSRRVFECGLSYLASHREDAEQLAALLNGIAGKGFDPHMLEADEPTQ